MSFLRTLTSLMRTQEGLPDRSPIAPSQARLTLEFFEMGFRKRSCNLFVWVSLSILLSLGPGCHIHPLRRSTSSSINPKPGTSSLGHVRGSSASACAMLCDHSEPTPAMHTMSAPLRPHAPVKTRESALIPFVTTRLPEVGPAYAWQLSRTPRIFPQTNICLSCALFPHSCAPGKDFPVGHPSLQAKHT
jgi:hypothetical protein